MQEDEAAPRGPVTPGGDAPGPAPDAPPPRPMAAPLPPLSAAPSRRPSFAAARLPRMDRLRRPRRTRVDVGSLLGRTFDTFGREWSLYLALALAGGPRRPAGPTTPMFELQLNGRLPPPTAAASH